MKYWKFRSWKNPKGGTAAVPPGGTATIYLPNPARTLHNNSFARDSWHQTNFAEVGLLNEWKSFFNSTNYLISFLFIRTILKRRA